MNNNPNANEGVRALRKIIGVTQAELAVMLGVSKDAVTGAGIATRQRSLQSWNNGVAVTSHPATRYDPTRSCRYVM
jgi:hypothetical protein